MKKTAVAFFVLLSGLCAFLLWGPRVTETIPPNAVMKCDIAHNICYPDQYFWKYIDFFSGRSTAIYQDMTLEAAQKVGMRIILSEDFPTRKHDYSVGASQNVLLHYLSQYGLWPKWKARWHKNGGWYW